MDYSDVLKRGWRGMWNGGTWAFYASALAAYLVLLFLAVAAAALLIVPALMPLRDSLSIGVPGFGQFATVFVAMGAAFIIASIIGLPLSLIMHGGLARLTFEAQEDRPVRAGTGWREGGRAMGRLFVFEFVLWMLVGLVLAVVVGGFGGAAALLSRDNAAAAVAAICLLYLALFVLGIAFTLLYTGFEALGMRYVVIEGLGGLDAFSAAGASLKHWMKQVVLMSLIMFGLQMAVGFATSMITSPLQFLTFSPQDFSGDPTALFASQGYWTSIAVVYLVSLVVQLPVTVFQYSVWTAFFRKVTGRDLAAEPESPSVYAQGYLPPPPQQYPTPPPPPQQYPMPPPPQQEYPTPPPPAAPPWPEDERPQS